MDGGTGKMKQIDITPEQIIEKLGLQPLTDEGGQVIRTYCSKTLTADGEAAGTAIYYLLKGQAFSHLHRLTGDEIYHFYMGDAVELTELLPDGTVEKTILGSDIMNGETPQHLVPAGNWQGSRLAEGGSWALLGTTMCPGYTDDRYEQGDPEILLAKYPSAEKEIRELTGQIRY